MIGAIFAIVALAAAGTAAVAASSAKREPDNGVGPRGSTTTKGPGMRLRGRRARVKDTFLRLYVDKSFDFLTYDKKIEKEWEIFFPPTKLPPSDTLARKIGTFSRATYKVVADITVKVGTNPKDPTHEIPCGTFYYDREVTPDKLTLLLPPTHGIGTTHGGYCYTAPGWQPLIGLLARGESWDVYLVVRKGDDTGRLTCVGTVDGHVLSLE